MTSLVNANLHKDTNPELTGCYVKIQNILKQSGYDFAKKMLNHKRSNEVYGCGYHNGVILVVCTLLR